MKQQSIVSRTALLLCLFIFLIAGCSQKQATPEDATGTGGAETEIQRETTPKSEPDAPEKAERKSYDQPPEMIIDPAKSYQATITTTMGAYTIELFAGEAPTTVNSFVFLARERYFDGIVFHRIVPGFVIQTGDPTGTGRGGPGYQFEDELDSSYKYEPGIVAMANAGPNTNGSQFFVCTGEDSRALNNYPDYTIFGRVVEGMDTVLAIDATPVEGQKPLEEVRIESIEIKEISAAS